MNIPKDTETPDKEYDSLETTHAFLSDAAADSIPTKATTQSSPRLRFVGTTLSLAASLPSVSTDGTKLGLDRSKSKMTGHHEVSLPGYTIA
jgi:hypothetical protein